jgi:dienelactone hydrolase
LTPLSHTEEMQTFEKEMNEAKVDYQLIKYSGAVHSFTQKKSGTDITKGVAYNEAADKRSMQALISFMNEITQK